MSLDAEMAIQDQKNLLMKKMNDCKDLLKTPLEKEFLKDEKRGVLDEQEVDVKRSDVSDDVEKSPEDCGHEEVGLDDNLSKDSTEKEDQLMKIKECSEDSTEEENQLMKIKGCSEDSTEQEDQLMKIKGCSEDSTEQEDQLMKIKGCSEDSTEEEDQLMKIKGCSEDSVEEDQKMKNKGCFIDSTEEDQKMKIKGCSADSTEEENQLMKIKGCSEDSVEEDHLIEIKGCSKDSTEKEEKESFQASVEIGDQKMKMKEQTNLIEENCFFISHFDSATSVIERFMQLASGREEQIKELFFCGVGIDIYKKSLRQIGFSDDDYTSTSGGRGLHFTADAHKAACMTNNSVLLKCKLLLPSCPSIPTTGPFILCQPQHVLPISFWHYRI